MCNLPEQMDNLWNETIVIIKGFCCNENEECWANSILHAVIRIWVFEAFAGRHASIVLYDMQAIYSVIAAFISDVRVI